MKKLNKIFLIIITCFLFLFPFYHPGADSGFDGSYSGGSSSSSWSSGSSSYHSSSSGSYSSSSSDPVEALIFMILMLIVLASIMLSAKKQSGNTTVINVPPYDLNKLKEVLPDFDEEKFKKESYNIYKDIQTAWMNFDYDTLRKNVTDEMYNMYKAQLTTLNVKKEVNVMKDFNLHSIKIIGMEIKDKIISLTVNMEVECFDYIEKNGKTVRGTDKRKVIYNYAMTFNKGISEKPNKCPNCNAPLDNVNSSKCPYCDSNIINENYDWVLSKKQVLNQRYK